MARLRKRKFCFGLTSSHNSVYFCKIIALTSVVWLLIDVTIFILLTSSQTSSSNDIDKKDITGKSEKLQHVNQVRHPEQTPENVDDKIDNHQKEDESHVKVNVVRNSEENQEKNGKKNGKDTAIHKKQEVKKAENPEVPMKQKPKTFRNILGKPYERDQHHPSGPGEMGTSVVHSREEKAERDKLFTINQFDLLACNKISVNRSLPDYRPFKCARAEHPTDLPTTSVVIVFHNEAECALLRTIHSVINRSPRQLLKEIILIDDASEERDYLHEKLDNYVSQLPVEVKIIRMAERSGLIKSRLAGAAVTTGKTITFLDSHCEVTLGWLEPMLALIAKNRTTVSVPVIDIIDKDNFHYKAMKTVTVVGGFDWSLNFGWFPLPEKERLRVRGDYSRAVQTPAMAGGLFTIDRDYFYEIGSYDDKMEIWGGENVEMSLRIWQCGGSIRIVPCSHVGHVFRTTSPYSWPGGVSKIVGRNNRRLAEVWMDEYKFLWFLVQPSAKHVIYGDVTERKALRSKLQCKSFKWYIENVWPESSFNIVLSRLGAIRNPKSNTCFDRMGKKEGGEVGVFGCHNQGGNQVFAFTERKEIRFERFCLDASGVGKVIKLVACHLMGGHQSWLLDEKTGNIIHKQTGGCITIENKSKLTIRNCEDNNLNQIWEMELAKELRSVFNLYNVDDKGR